METQGERQTETGKLKNGQTERLRVRERLEDGEIEMLRCGEMERETIDGDEERQRDKELERHMERLRDRNRKTEN